VTHYLWRANAGANDSRQMRIALTVDPEIPVPPGGYGGIERIVDMLARGLVTRGHEVTIFAHSDSTTAGRLIAWPGRMSQSRHDTVRNALTLVRHIAGGSFDLVHSFSRVAYLAPLLPLSLPKLMTYQRHISLRSVRLGHNLSRGTLWFTAISRFLIRDVETIGRWKLVFNGVSLTDYDFCSNPGPDAPLVFLGRVEEIKGPHLAIEIARRSGVRLVIAGNVPQDHAAFFDRAIRPHVDGSRVTYVGPVDNQAKNALLGRARALLMPVLWDEPFGIVMAEAMACGTPVIGLARGAVPEVVDDAVTGYVADDTDGLVEAVLRLDRIDRKACRVRVGNLFSDEVIVPQYEAIYHEMLGITAGLELSA